MADTTISFHVDLPANYIPDNQFGHKLFESVELSLNHEQVSRKATALDYAVSEAFFQKCMFDDSYVMTALDVAGRVLIFFYILHLKKKFKKFLIQKRHLR